MKTDAFGALGTFEAGQGPVGYYRLGALERDGLAGNLDTLPFSIKVLLESLLRNVDGELVTEDDVRRLAGWSAARPPATGIVHQVNLEFLAAGVMSGRRDGKTVAFPDTLVGTDSHTTMINGLGVLGWGVGGIEAEAAMLGQPLYMITPHVVGFHLTGKLPDGVTATDLVLTVTQMLRKKGVVEKFVEFYGPGLSQMSLADRATVANMSPEYGATCGYFPVDDETLRYLRGTGRAAAAEMVERYCKEQDLFRT